MSFHYLISNRNTESDRAKCKVHVNTKVASAQMTQMYTKSISLWCRVVGLYVMSLAKQNWMCWHWTIVELYRFDPGWPYQAVLCFTNYHGKHQAPFKHKYSIQSLKSFFTDSEMPVKQRNVGNSDTTSGTTKDSSTNNQKKSGPFSGRYNPT